MTEPTGTILTCDDEDGFRNLVADVLRDEGHQVFTAADLGQARELLSGMTPDLLLVDLRLPDGDGLELIGELQSLAPGCLSLVMTAYASVQSAVEALRLGAHDYLEKPVRMDDLVAKVSILLRHKTLMRENQALRTAVGFKGGHADFVAISPVMEALKDQARRIAERGRVALLTGESGAGKEVVARYIHNNGPGSRAPFVPVNLASLTEGLAEPQLFGHVRGAFTGAVKASEGLARAAGGGTLFLDEISEAPLALQAKLLRLVDLNEILPVGATQPLKVDCRLLAASNRDIEDEVRDGRFREDLFHRLNVVHLQIPPLRDRREGIPVLARTLAASLARDRGLPTPTISEGAQRALAMYRWPGNVRQLKNVLERALILGSGLEIGVRDLPSEVIGGADDSLGLSSNLREAMSVHEQRHVQKVLDSVKGDRRKAAPLLGISLATLYRKLET
ncbi:MAG: sigma-54 dependent transcriptional regulator [Myxococcota bacterium]